MPKLESDFKRAFLNEVRQLFPGVTVISPDPTTQQGIPDTILLYRSTWAALEFKRDSKANVRPNQRYYISQFGEMSYAAFVYPENKGEVLNALQQTFGARG